MGGVRRTRRRRRKVRSRTAQPWDCREAHFLFSGRWNFAPSVPACHAVEVVPPGPRRRVHLFSGPRPRQTPNAESEKRGESSGAGRIPANAIWDTGRPPDGRNGGMTSGILDHYPSSSARRRLVVMRAQSTVPECQPREICVMKRTARAPVQLTHKRPGGPGPALFARRLRRAVCRSAPGRPPGLVLQRQTVLVLPAGGFRRCAPALVPCPFQTSPPRACRRMENPSGRFVNMGVHRSLFQFQSRTARRRS